MCSPSYVDTELKEGCGLTEIAKQEKAGIDSGLESLRKALRVSFNLLVVFMIGTILFFLWKCVFIVEAPDVGIILRFGQVVAKDGKAVLSDGAYLTYPYPIDQQVRLTTGSQSIKSSALWNDPAKEKTPPTILIPGQHDYALTGDTNIVHIEWTLSYVISDPLAYIQHFGVPTETTPKPHEATLQRLLTQSATQAIAGLPVDSVWREKNEQVTQEVRRILEEEITELKLGIGVEGVTYKRRAPTVVKKEFDAVTAAAQQQEKLIAEAQGAAQRTTSNARVNAAGMIADANAQKSQKVSAASADAEVFKRLYAQYEKNPDLFRRLYFEERIRKVLEKVDEKYIIDAKEQREIRLQLNREKTKKGGADGTGN